MNHKQALPKKRLLTSALLLALAPATHAIAQDQSAQAEAAGNPNAAADPTELDTVVVTGIRASLTSSMNLKRDAQGVVLGTVLPIEPVAHLGGCGRLYLFQPGRQPDSAPVHQQRINRRSAAPDDALRAALARQRAH